MLWRFLLDHARPYRGRLLGIAALAIASSLVTLAIPWLAARFLGGLIEPAATSPASLVLLLAAALGTIAALAIASAVLAGETSARILADLRLAAYTHLQRLPAGFHDRSRQGDLLSITTFETSALSSFLTGTLAGVPALLLTAGGAFVLVFLIDPVLALFLPLTMPVFYLVMKLAGRRLRTIGRRGQKAESAVVTAAEAHLEIWSAIKSFAVEDEHRAIYARLVEHARITSVAYARVNALIGPLIGLVAALVTVGLALAAGDRLAAQRDPAELFAFLLYAALLSRPLGSLANLYGQIQWAMGSLARLQSVFAELEEPGYAAQGALNHVRGEIAFENVSFAYPGRGLVIDKLDIVFAPGTVTALTGDNGSGKTTLVKLLTRLYDPQQGRILIDGQDIAAIQVQDLRHRIGLVPQVAALYDGTVAQNVAFGDPRPDLGSLQRALDVAGAQFVASLPDGLDTLIGDRGLRLSGGQRQRIALARALYRDPPILVFDEATSMYDPQAELDFVDKCRDALQGRTVIIVTHRPASLALADRVVRMEGGRIADG